MNKSFPLNKKPHEIGTVASCLLQTHYCCVLLLNLTCRFNLINHNLRVKDIWWHMKGQLSVRQCLRERPQLWQCCTSFKEASASLFSKRLVLKISANLHSYCWHKQYCSFLDSPTISFQFKKEESLWCSTLQQGGGKVFLLLCKLWC